MNVAVYHPWVYLKGGAERTLLELLRRSRHTWTLYTNHYDPGGTFPEFRDVRVVELERVSVRRTIKDVGSACLRVLAQPLPLEDAAALLVSSEGLGNLAVLRPRGLPTFCFCHTPLKVVYDPFTRHRYFTQQQPGRLMRSALALYTTVDRWGWSRYERVFCNSQEVASRVLNAKLVAPERVEVLHPGVDIHRYQATGCHERFFLLPGRIARTKHVELGIDAFIRMKEQLGGSHGFRLVVAGMVDEKSKPYLRELRARAADHLDIEFVIEPSDATLIDLYRRCYAVLFAALNEDWGLVTLEAMASGKPVVAVARGGPLESVVDGATGWLRPPVAADFAAAMGQLVQQPDQAAAMGKAARQRSTLFHWDGFVHRMDAYVDALASTAPAGAGKRARADRLLDLGN